MKYDNLFPETKITKNKAILRKFWNGNIKTVWSSYSDENQYRQLENETEMVSEAVKNIVKCSEMPGINIPRFMVDFGTVSTASYWGGAVKRQSFGNPWIDTIVHKPEDIETLKPSDPCGGDCEKAERLYDLVAEKMMTNNLATTTFDIQGPLNTLSLVWDQDNMMISMYEDPEKVHKALVMITEQLIANIDCLLERLPNIEGPLWPFIWLPKDIGIGITEDYMPLLSPELYKEFGIPYVEQLSNRYKGLFIHCCGEFSHHIENLYNSQVNILGMEFVYPNISIDKIFSVFRDSCIFVPNIMDNRIEEFGSYTDYLRYIESVRLQETRIWYILRPELPDFENQVEFMESICDL